MKRWFLTFRIFLPLFLYLVLMSCRNEKEYTIDEIELLKRQSRDELLSRTVYKPSTDQWLPGKTGGIWKDTITNDPKTFNTLTARDGDSRTVIDPLFDELADYDYTKKIFIPNLASFKIVTDEKKDKLDVIYTLRDDLYWTTMDGKVKEKVTSDDVVFWYDEISHEKKLQLPDYSSQYITMKDGSQERVTIEKIDDRSFVFHFPRIISEPVFYSSMNFGPRYIFEKVKKEKGVEALLELFSVDTDVKTIPSLGKYYLAEYTQGVRVVLKRNPNYWKKDEKNTRYPYIDTVIYNIVPDINTDFLLFNKGSKDQYAVTADKLKDILSVNNADFTVYNGGASQGASFIVFNQNKNHMDPLVYSWFKEKKFRQAMSCFFDRERVIKQVFRGLAEPAYSIYAKANPYYDPQIKMKYIYNPEMGIQLLSEIGIKKDSSGMMRDSKGNRIEFELICGAENYMSIDILTIFADELKKQGINGKVKPIDFQKLVDMLIKTYEWHVATASLGANTWPGQGTNVWQSKGNFHLWHPLQETPATEWEKRIDYLFNEGMFTLDKSKAKTIWDEFQSILLDEVPLMYTVHSYTFRAVKNKWENVYFDNMRGLDTTYVYLKNQGQGD